MPHQVRVWHAYSEMIEDYTEQRLQEKMRTPEGRRLALTIDPYSYRDTLTLPKLLIHSLNDRYWATDALNLYWDDLPGDKHLLYVPNQPHNIADRVHVRPAIAAFVQAVLSDARLPVLAAEFRETEEALDVTLRAGPPALEARLWSATAPTQDFRAALWEPLPLERSAAQGAFAAHIARPSSGFAALVADCLLSDPGEPYLLSSRVHILGSSPD
jgi:PhoPQ-activated pathogenicity-related protein